MPLILENKSCVVIEIKGGVSEFRVVPVCRQQHEAAAHSEVCDQRPTVVQIKQNVLAAAVDAVDLSILQFTGKLLLCGVGRKTFSQERRLSNTESTDQFVEGTGDKFYFG
jgi:hypothetical protein